MVLHEDCGRVDRRQPFFMPAFSLKEDAGFFVHTSCVYILLASGLDVCVTFYKLCLTALVILLSTLRVFLSLHFVILALFYFLVKVLLLKFDHGSFFFVPALLIRCGLLCV